VCIYDEQELPVTTAYLDEAVVVEEAEHGGPGGGEVPVAGGGDVGDDLVDRGARLGVEVERQPVPLRRPPGSDRRGRLGQRLRLPGARRPAEGRDDQQQEDQADATAEADASRGTHRWLVCYGEEEASVGTNSEAPARG
jgi:hypothetical protein